jgi:PmbA protein
MDTIFLKTKLAEIAERALARAKRGGASAAEAGVSYDEGLSVTVRLGTLESLERQRDRGLAVTVYRDGRKGSASTADFSDAAVEEAVDRALSIARFTEPDEYAGLAEPDRLATEPRDLDLYHPWDLSVADAEALALETETAARSADARISNSDGATVNSHESFRIYANSHGFCAGYPTTYHSNSCAVLAQDDNAMERDYWYTVARGPEDLQAGASIGAHAAERALRRLGARQIPTVKAPVVFPAELARGLLGHLIAAISGTSQYRRASFLLDAKGRQILPSFAQVDEDPFIPRAMGSVPFDREGVAVAPRRLVEAGVLNGYVLSSYSARRLDTQTTGNAGGIHNLIVRPSAGDLRSLLAPLEGAFLVGELMGQGANTVTGDYSRGAAGFWVEHGEIQYPVNEVTIAGNLAEMLGGITAFGSDVDQRGTIRCGSIVVGEMTIAGS